MSGRVISSSTWDSLSLGLLTTLIKMSRWTDPVPRVYTPFDNKTYKSTPKNPPLVVNLVGSTSFRLPRGITPTPSGLVNFRPYLVEDWRNSFFLKTDVYRKPAVNVEKGLGDLTTDGVV